MAEWILKRLYTYCPQEILFRPRDTYRQKIRRRKNIFHATANKKRTGIQELISGKKQKRL